MFVFWHLNPETETSSSSKNHLSHHTNACLCRELNSAPVNVVVRLANQLANRSVTVPEIDINSQQLQQLKLPQLRRNFQEWLLFLNSIDFLSHRKSIYFLNKLTQLIFIHFVALDSDFSIRSDFGIRKYISLEIVFFKPAILQMQRYKYGP